MFKIDEFVLTLYIFALTVLMLFSSQGAIMLYYQNKYRLNKPKERKRKNFTEPVTIQLPIYNEYYVAQRLMDAICEVDYPRHLLEIQVLDDSTDETSDLLKKIVEEKQKEGFDVKYIHRNNRKGFKAGALREGLKTAKGKYIAIFDADFIPRKDFLKKTLGYFTSSRIGMVQTRWEHLNEDYSLITQVQALALNGHFVIEQTVRNRSGFFINFNGTGGVWRKECIEDAGNWEDDTLTEDLDLSYRAQLKGWKFIYLDDFTTPSELPIEMNALKTQQYRWTKGAIETAKKILPLLWRSAEPFRIKLLGTFHLTSNLVFPFILLTGILNVPLIFIKNSGPFDLIFNLMSIFIFAFISSFFFYLYAQKNIYPDWRKRILLFPIFMAGSMGLALNNTKAVIEGLLNRKSEFVRTPKFNAEGKYATVENNKYVQSLKTNSSAYVELLLAFYCFIGVAASIYFGEIAALPFQLMFFGGFLEVGWLSFRSSSRKSFKNKKSVLDVQ